MQITLLVVVAVGFSVGAGWRTYTEVSPAVLVWLLLVALVLALLWRRTSSAGSAPFPLLGSLFLVFCALGIMRSEVAAWQFGGSPLASFLDETVELSGVVAREPDYRERVVQLYIETDTDTILVSTDRMHDVSYGDIVTVTGTLAEPAAFTTDLGRTFNYPGYLKARGVEYQVSFADIVVTDTGAGNVVVTNLLQVKQAFVAVLQRVIPEPAVGLGVGLLLGVQSALGDAIEEQFRRTGIIHIVVLSGYNVMLVVAFILFVFSFFLTLRWRLVAAVLAITAFALIVGLSATVVRASIMAVLVLIAQATGRQYDVLRALIFAGLVMLVINPYLLLYDVGFQLSFMATLGLILAVPSFEATTMQETRKLGVRAFFFATLATQVAVLPLLLYHIGQVSLIAVLANVLILPMVPAAMLLTFFTGLVGFLFLPLASVVGLIATLSLQYILTIAKWLAAVPFAAVTVPEFPAIGIPFLYTLLGAGWVLLKRYQTKQPSVSLAGWTIEVETENAGVRGEGARNRTPALEDELPVYFR